VNELFRAMRRARATPIDDPITRVSLREKLIRLSRRHQGQSELEIQTVIDHLHKIEMMPDAEARPLLEHIMRACCVYYGVTRDEFLSAARYAHMVTARQVAFYLAKTMTNKSISIIGRIMNKDRANIEHGYTIICKKILSNDNLLSDIDHIKKEIQHYINEDLRGEG
jgi:chromosomal replication initiation ATPase DnaA